MSGCKITDVLRGGIGWDYLGLSINAYSHSLLPPLPCPHYFPINLTALCGCNVFVAVVRRVVGLGGRGLAVGADEVARRGCAGDRSSSYIIKHYTLGRTRYQGLSDCVSLARRQRRRRSRSYGGQDEEGLLPVVHKSTLLLN